MKVAGTTYHDIEITDGEVDRIIKSTLSRLVGIYSPEHGFNHVINDNGKLVRLEDYRGRIERTIIRDATNEDRVVIKIFKMLDNVTKAKQARK